MSVNKVQLLGRLGKDPELKYTPSGVAVCTFSVATSDHWTDKDGKKQEKTQWHNIVTWQKTAELANQYLKKGSQAFLEGKIETRNYEVEGQKRYITEIIVNNIQFVGSRDSNAGGNSAPAPDAAPQQNDASFAADDIPF